MSNSEKELLTTRREDLICKYYKNLATNGKKNTLSTDEDNIKNFKNKLLTDIAVIVGKINANQRAIGQGMRDKLDITGNHAQKLKENGAKHLSGTQLKKDIYEENTRHTISLIYYILGMGFMGYYIIKLLKK
jgi:hypothetical protein